MLRPVNEVFLEWAASDSNVTRVHDALIKYPDLIRVTDMVYYILTKLVELSLYLRHKTHKFSIDKY